MITPSLARMLAQEHLYNPIKGEVLTLGKQWIPMTHDEAVSVLREAGITISQAVIDEAQSQSEATTRYSEKGHISDQHFYKLLGVEGNVTSMDVTDYEGCDIIHDLNLPIPDNLKGKYDFVIDGGTFDHLMNTKVCFANVVELLKPTGRVFQWNAASNFTGCAYLSFGPDLFYDFFTLNNFKDCKVYIADGYTIDQAIDWDMYFYDKPTDYAHFISPRMQMVIVIAERQASTTSHKIPIQYQYRTPEYDATEYKVSRDSSDASARPILKGTDSDFFERHPERLGVPPLENTPTPPPHKGFRYVGKL